jgi:AraC-like DNA-binding protein
MGAGVLHAGAAATRFTLERYPPPEDLAPFVDFCWVMRRARLHEAALRAEADGSAAVDWAALAVDLGYADQAHLTRDFTATLGVPPTRYATAQS